MREQFTAMLKDAMKAGDKRRVSTVRIRHRLYPALATAAPAMPITTAARMTIITFAITIQLSPLPSPAGGRLLADGFTGG